MLFFLGAFVTALGTHTFPSSGLAFMSQAGLSLAAIGGIMMSNRLATVLVNLFLGDWIDRKNPAYLIGGAELINVLVTLTLIAVWPDVTNLLLVFIVAVFCRSTLIALTLPCQQKIIKGMTENHPEKIKPYTILINWVNYGSGIFAAAIAFYAIKYRSFEFVLWIDGLTFIVNGILIFVGFRYSTFQSLAKGSLNPFKPFKKFFELNRLDPKLFWADIFLHLSVFGTNIFMIRLVRGQVENIPILLISFALAVWVSTFLLHKFDPLRIVKISWFFLPVSFLWLLLAPPSLGGQLAGVFLRNICYWNIFTHHSVQIQRGSASTNIVQLTSARTALNTLILGVGELLMGYLSNFISIETELLVRVGLGVAFAFYTIALRPRSESLLVQTPAK